MNATSTPIVIIDCVPRTANKVLHETPSETVDTERCRRIPFPPNQIMLATATDDRISTTG